MENFGSWEELEMNKIHVLVHKNLTKMKFRRTTSKKGNKKCRTVRSAATGMKES
jgi:hypothetical protein